MAGRYEWMLDNAGAGYGIMGGYGGRGGMMGGLYGKQNGSGKFTLVHAMAIGPAAQTLSPSPKS